MNITITPPTMNNNTHTNCIQVVCLQNITGIIM